MSSIVLRIPHESTTAFQAGVAALEPGLRERVRKWAAATFFALDDAAYIPLRTDWIPSTDRKTVDGVEVLLAGRWPSEVQQVIDAGNAPRIAASAIGEIWRAICNGSGKDMETAAVHDESTADGGAAVESPVATLETDAGNVDRVPEERPGAAPAEADEEGADLNGCEQSEASEVAPESASDEHVLSPAPVVAYTDAVGGAVEALDPDGGVDPEVPTSRDDPVIPDAEIDAAIPWAAGGDGVDTLTPIVKTLEHYGARFRPGFFDQPIEEVRAGLKVAARDGKVVATYRREQEAEAKRIEARRREDEEDEAAMLRAQHTRSDAGNADRFVATFGDDVRYCDAFKGWYVWNGQYWARDDTKQILALATEVARGIYREAQVCPDADTRQALGKWAVATESLNRRKAMIESVAPYVALRPDDLDAHPMLLNCRNGTLDLATMAFREPRREDLLTKQAGVDYTPGATCPAWLAHLDLILAGDEEVIDGFQQMAGYSLLDGNPEQAMFILFGRGKNGKSVTMRVLSEVLGDYAVNVAPESLMIKGNDVIRSDLARLKGARMATSSEGTEGALLAENVVKSLTGNEDKITVARKYENEFEFIPTAKIWLGTNHEPRIKGTDDGIWRRIWLIPFEVQIPEGMRNPRITDTLLEERAGILNWMLAGLQKYWDQGGRLRPPDKVIAATKQYRKESDVLGRAIDEEFVSGEAAKGRILARKELTAGLRRWFEEQDERMPGPQKIARALRERGVADGPVQTGVRYWLHLRWKTDEEQEDDAIGR